MSLLYDFGYHPCADCVSAFTYGEPQLFFHGYRGDQDYFELDVISGHHHLDLFGEGDYSGNVCGPEVELGPVSVKERCVTAAFFFT